MITLLWLIRSRQAITTGESFWQDDWFLASMLTLMAMLADMAIIGTLLIIL